VVCDEVVWSDADISGILASMRRDAARCWFRAGSARPHHRHGFPPLFNRVVRIATMRTKARIDGGGVLAPPVSARIRIFRGYQGLAAGFTGPKTPFLLASVACILYPDTCLACERPRP
jgi:hypothetical protein